MNRKILIFVGLPLALCVTTFAQSTAKIQGKITDPSGAAVAGAGVVVRNQAFALERTVATDTDGNFQVALLPPGAYSVEVQARGFNRETVDDLTLEGNRTLVLDLRLRIAGAARATNVTVPEISWPYSLFGFNVRGVAVDFLIRYSVRVPLGAAANYRVNLDICRWVPSVETIPDEISSCTSTAKIPVSALREIEPGTYQGVLRFGYDPTNLEQGKVNRYSFTLNLWQSDSIDPERAIAKQELNHIIFEGLRIKPDLFRPTPPAQKN